MSADLEWEAFNTGHTCQCFVEGHHEDHVCTYCGLILTGAQLAAMRERFVPITDAGHDEMTGKYGGRS